jgi:chemosensory pili system protein ChpA (sensor histidine kinase/response regulator)
VADKELIGGLKWVKGEIGATLRPVRDLVEAGADFEAETELAAVLKSLDQVQGVLLALRLTTPARLVEEMHRLAECLEETEPEHYTEATVVLGQALDQLANHLDRLDAGFEEPPLSLWSIINALRSARDQLPLTRSELLRFAISDQDGHSHWIPEELDILAEVIRQVRPQFHRHLVEWYRRDTQGLTQLGRLFHQLHDYLKDGLLADLFRLAEMFASALQDGRLESSPRARTLMGHMDWALKPLTQRPPVWPEVDAKALIEQLLEILVEAGIEDDALTEARMTYGPAPAVPIEAETQATLEAEAALAGLAGELVIELDDLKTTFDRLTLAESAAQDSIQDFSDRLRRLATRLDEVEVGNLPARLRALADRFQTLDATDLKGQAARLESYAMELLGIESVLLALADRRDAGAERLIAPDMDLSDLTAATLREAGYELSRVKEAIADWQSDPQSREILSPIQSYLAGVSGALRILGENPAADLAELVAGLVQAAYVRHQRLPTDIQIDHLADAIAGLELYIGHLQQPMPLGETLIDRAGQAISSLQTELGELPAATETPEAAAIPEPVIEEAEHSEPEFELELPLEPEPETRPPADDLDLESEDGETEFLDIFLEEAREEIDSARTQLARWQSDPSEADALATLRRSFHTLKGSGRLVGALQVGDFAQAMEFLLNRLIETESRPSTQILDCIAEAVRVLPELVESEAEGRPFDIEPYVMRATRLREDIGAEGPPELQPSAEFQPLAEPEPSAEPEPPVAEVGTSAPVEDSLDHDSLFAADAELLDIFRAETLEHLSVVRAFLEGDESGVEQPLDESIERALHTLTGSARMSGIESIARVTRAMELCIKPRRASGAPLSAPLVALFRRAAEAIEQRVAELPESGTGATTLAALWSELTSPSLQTPEPEHRPATDVEPLELEVPDLAPVELELDVAFEDESSPESFAAVDERVPESFVELEESLQLDAPIAEEVSELDLELEAEPSTAEEHSRQDTEHVRGSDSALEPEFEPEPAIELESLPELEPETAQADALESIQEPEPDTQQPYIETASAWAEAPQPSAPAVQPPPTPEAEPAPAEPQAAPDPELAALFLEDARDLLDKLDRQFRDWLLAPQDGAALAGVNRLLHTLKGSARLTGLPAIGDLSHALETRLKALDEDQTGINDLTLELAQRAVDMLSLQVDALEQGAAIPRMTELVDELSRAPHAEPTTETATPEVALMRPAETAEPSVPAPMDRPLPTPAATPTEPVTREGGGTIAAIPQIRVRSDLLNRLVNHAGEISIYRGRLTQRNGQLGFGLGELDQTVVRLREQLRQLEIETQAQILNRFERGGEAAERAESAADYDAEFDPLEFDRFSRLQQLSGSLAETINDLISVKEMLAGYQREMTDLLNQQARLADDLQDGLLRTRLVPFVQVVPRLHRLVRQTADSLGKSARLEVIGPEVELDRTILDRLVAPLEHLLRNAVDHGLEDTKTRVARGKPATGMVTLALRREGNDAVISLGDDGKGLDLEAIRRQAIARGLMTADSKLPDEAVLQFIMEPGFTTSGKVTQISGRGVGLDVVASEIKAANGTMSLESVPGKGARFTIRLPLTLAIIDAFLVSVGDTVYAVPHSTVEGLARISREELLATYADPTKTYTVRGHRYRVAYLGQALEANGPEPDLGERRWLPVLLARIGDQRVALQADTLLESQRILVKPLGLQLAGVRWLSGGTILPDGRVALILDALALVRSGAIREQAPVLIAPEPAGESVCVMVVDDSLTVRRVTSRLLRRQNIEVLTAKDGVEALTLLDERVPDVILLDVEMPRMDGYELTRHIRRSERLKHLPIIMITSRTGAKHRDYATQLGVNRYLGKPYQESQLLDEINALVGKASG